MSRTDRAFVSDYVNCPVPVVICQVSGPGSRRGDFCLPFSTDCKFRGIFRFYGIEIEPSAYPGIHGSTV
jgi:hypothetical protein